MFYADASGSSFGGSGVGSRREAAALQRAMELAMGVAPQGSDANYRRVTATTVIDEVRSRFHHKNAKETGRFLGAAGPVF